jgi:hypothetical protein
MTVRTVYAAGSLSGTTVEFYTQKLSDEDYEGGWSLVHDPMVVFSDHNMDGNSMTNHGGTVAGTAGGVPVQLVFWGGWWNGNAGTRAAIEAQTQRLLASRYFSQLTQYGIPHAPVWRGSTTVTKPAPPASASSKDTMRAALDLIDDLIDDDVFPDPDDGPRIAFLVMMPGGFVVTGAGAPLGAHWYDYDFDGPFDTDNYWAGWVRLLDPLGAAPDRTVRVLAHELIEIITDPEGDGWHTENDTPNNELVDPGGSPNAGATRRTTNFTTQTAFTDDVQLQAYWSQSLGRTVIPLNDGYAARLTASIRETERRETQAGTFRPTGGRLSFCIEDRDYWWSVDDVDEHVSVRLQANGFRSPVATGWVLNGQACAAAAGVLALPVTSLGYTGRERVSQPAVASISYVTSTSGIELDVTGSDGGFELVVGCQVTDAAITGNVQSQPTATPHVEVGVRGVELRTDPAYTKQFEHCLQVFTKRWQEQYDPLRRPRPGDPPVFDPGDLRSRQPLFVTQEEWHRARDVARGITAAYATLDTEGARDYARGLLEALPSVAAQLSAEEIDHQMRERAEQKHGRRDRTDDTSAD